MPPSDLISKFNKQAEELLARVLVSRRESQSLATLRDTLLPKLISGEIGVSNAERFVGKAIA